MTLLTLLVIYIIGCLLNLGGVVWCGVKFKPPWDATLVELFAIMVMLSWFSTGMITIIMALLHVIKIAEEEENGQNTTGV